MPSGCSCNAGFSGLVRAVVGSPFYNTTLFCSAVACPSLSSGSSVASGCTCLAGYSGSVIATNTTPFFVSTCTGTLELVV